MKFILRVLDVTAFDSTDDIWWRTDNEYAPVTFWVTVNDCFYWASADLEKITPENVGELEKAYADCRAAMGGVGGIGEIYAPMLFAARMRKMRPQGAAYPQEKELWPLFDAAGPERETDSLPFGNPRPHPRDKKVEVTT